MKTIDQPINRPSPQPSGRGDTTYYGFYGHFLAVCFLLVVPFGVAGALGAAPLAGLLGFIALCFWPQMLLDFKRFEWIIFICFTIYAALSFFWSSYNSAELVPKLFGMAILYSASFLVIRRLTDHQKSIARRAVIAATLGFATLLLVELLFNYPLTSMNRQVEISAQNPHRDFPKGLVWLSLLLPAATLLLKDLNFRMSTIVVVGLWSACLFASVQLGMFAATLALFFGAIIMLIPASTQKQFLKSLLRFLALTMLCAPLLPLFSNYLVTLNLNGMPVSFQHRIHTWSHLADHIFSSSFWFGEGLDGSRAISGRKIIDGIDLELVSLHPHNMPVQIWLELGFVGALLISAFIWVVSVRIGTVWDLISKQVRAFNGLIAIILPYYFFSFGVWQEWWWGAVASAIVAIFLLARVETNEASR